MKPMVVYRPCSGTASDFSACVHSRYPDCSGRSLPVSGVDALPAVEVAAEG